MSFKWTNLGSESLSLLWPRRRGTPDRCAERFKKLALWVYSNFFEFIVPCVRWQHLLQTHQAPVGRMIAFINQIPPNGFYIRRKIFRFLCNLYESKLREGAGNAGRAWHRPSSFKLDPAKHVSMHGTLGIHHPTGHSFKLHKVLRLHLPLLYHRHLVGTSVSISALPWEPPLTQNSYTESNWCLHEFSLPRLNNTMVYFLKTP